MRAVILAAGRGSRMKDLTEDRPKCLVELAGRSLLDLQCAALRTGGATEIGAVTGYRGETLQGRGLHLFSNPRWAETNMVMSLTAALSWLRAAPCLVSYADIFYPAETVRRMIAASGEIVIAYDPAWLALWQARFADPLADAESFAIDADGRLTDIGRKVATLAEITGQYMGLLKFTPKGWAEVEAFLAGLDPAQRDKLDMTGLLSRLLRAGIRIDTVPTAPGWGEVDAETDLDYYAAEVAAGRLNLPG